MITVVGPASVAEGEQMAQERPDGTRETTNLRELRSMHHEFQRFLLSYKFGSDEMMTKVNILKEEFELVHDYSPIEHVSARLKTLESIVSKAQRRNITLSLKEIGANIRDIAGVRITCSFISDTYWIRDMLVAQDDVTVVEAKDYIEAPKANGYRSLHLLLEVPVFTSRDTQQVPVEVQVRTSAMDFWASLEHKIFYKYHGEVPSTLRDDLRQAAAVAHQLDEKMESLHREVRSLEPGPKGGDLDEGMLGRELSEELLRALTPSGNTYTKRPGGPRRHRQARPGAAPDPHTENL
jgi:putative GTP pyrophosphokinase